MPETRGISKNALRSVGPQGLLYGSVGGKKEAEIESMNANSVGPGLLPIRFRESQGFFIFYLTTVHGYKFIHTIPGLLSRGTFQGTFLALSKLFLGKSNSAL